MNLGLVVEVVVVVVAASLELFAPYEIACFPGLFSTIPSAGCFAQASWFPSILEVESGGFRRLSSVEALPGNTKDVLGMSRCWTIPSDHPNFFTASSAATSLTAAYLIVVRGSAWPRRLWTILVDTPRSQSLVANVALKECRLKRRLPW